MKQPITLSKLLQRIESTLIYPLSQLCVLFLSPKNTNSQLKYIDWKTIISQAQLHRVINPINKVIQAQNLEIERETYQELTNINQREVLKMLALAKETGVICGILKRAFIGVIPLKGPIAAKQIYNDFTAKNSRDIDLLIRLEHVETVIQLLEQQGYVLSYNYHSLNTKQKSALKKGNNQLAFFHPKKRIQVEVHWRLFSNNYLLPIKFDELLKDTVQVSVGRNVINALSNKHLLFYLCCHGAKHHWSLLYWLLELACLLKKESYNWEDILQESQRIGIDRPLIQGVILVEYFFEEKAPQIIKSHFQKNKIIRNLVKSSIIAIQMDQKELKERTIINYWQSLTYKLKLKKNFRYKLSYFNFISINDFHVVRLPESIFFLYYPLRPVLWCKRYLLR